MKIVALKERASYETRCAITPDTARLFVQKGFKVCVEEGIGLASGFGNQDYLDGGANVSKVPLEVISDADIILKVQPSELEIEAKQGAIIIGLITQHHDYITKLKDRKLLAIGMELVPRITRAQTMDVLSSQNNLAGYRAVIEAAYHFNKAFPMMMTAAGMINPAKVLVIGVGVAGLQAIATAKRLGAKICAYDVRSSAQEQAESLGAKFIFPEELKSGSLEDKSGYAKEASEEYKRKQEEFLSSVIKDYDIVITTAQIPNKRAPVLVTQKMLDTMKSGAVIVDLASGSGGNVAGSKADEIIIINGVKVIGFSHLACSLASDSSRLYAKNVYNFVEHATKSGTFNLEDEIVSKMLLV